MLKKSDLAKQFELVVQQEIKNYQDSHNLVLQSLRDLKDEIKKNREDLNSLKSLIYIDNGLISSKFEKISPAVNTLEENLNRALREQSIINQDIDLDVCTLVTDLLRLTDKQGNITTSFYNLQERICKLEEEIKTNKRIVNDNMDDLLRRCREEIARVKKQIIESPSEAAQVKSELEEKISCHKVDVDGIMRELRIYKHDNMVTQKKIEHLYTLIERLKKLEVNSEPSIDH